MLMILLYGIATFAETGIGIWMFGKMFPRRESVSNSWVARIILWTLLILTTYTMHRAYGKEYIYEKYFFICIYLVIIILNVAVYKYGIFFRIDEKTMKVILFIYISAMLTWQYWVSYLSFLTVILANVYLPFFLIIFYKCDFFQAYLWEVLYLTNLGFMKIVYMFITGLVKERRMYDFVFSKSMHFYSGGVYLILICMVVLCLQKSFRIETWLSEFLKYHKKVLLFGLVSECIVLYLLLTMNWGYVQNKDLIIGLVTVSGIILLLLFVLAYFFAKSIDTEKNILKIRNNIIVKQYEELNENIKKYKCLLHDEKHMLNYIEECIRTGNLEEIQNVIRKNRDKFAEQYYYTGVTVLDNIIAIAKRKMDDANIVFYAEIDVTDIVIEQLDFIILLENLFDNAIESALKCEKERKIFLNIENVNSVLILKLWNTSCKVPHVKKDRFITDKDDSNVHGWGVESVKSIVNKYNGSIEFKYDETFFEVDIII